MRLTIQTFCSLVLLLVLPAAALAYPFDVSTDIRSGLEQDNRVVCFNEKAYIIGRAGQYAAGDGTITVVSLNDLTALPEARYSVGIGSNPYDIAFHDGTRAYVSRYNSGDVAIIDPRDGTVTGTIVPSDYGCSAYASPSYLCVVQNWNGFSRTDSRLFIAVQDGWGSPGKVLVFDTATDTHLATISLTLQNPNADMDYAGGKLYVSCTGDWSTPATAGMQVIDVQARSEGTYTYPVSVLGTAADFDDAAVTVHDIEIVNSDLWFVVVGNNWGYNFNIIQIDAAGLSPLYASYTTDYLNNLTAYLPGYLFIGQSDKTTSTGTAFPVYDFAHEVFLDQVSAGAEEVYSLAAHRDMVLFSTSNYDFQNPAGHLGSVERDNPLYTGAAVTVESLVRGPLDIAHPGGDTASYGTEADALGFYDGAVVSLGDGGSIVLSFGTDTVVENVAGPDIGVYENGFFQNWPANAGHTGYYFELGFVEVSSDGVTFARFPNKTANTAAIGGFDMLRPLDYFGLAGNSLGAISCNFDLDDLAEDDLVISGQVDLAEIRYVRIVDVVGDGSTTDSLGNPVYDPYPTAFSSGGFDLDAVEAFVTEDPTLITLSGFTAAPGRNQVQLTWKTGSEIDNAGFNLYRAESENGDFVRLNGKLIPSQGSATTGAAYTFVDDSVQNRKKYVYILEDVDTSGRATTHGPVMAMPLWMYGSIGH